MYQIILRRALFPLALWGAAAAAEAATIETNSDLVLSWDNRARLTTLYQPHRAYPNALYDCGCSYGGGFTSGRLDWLSELDADYHGDGLHVSAAAWYDQIDRDDFEGRRIELFEAFLHGGSDRLSFRVGRYSLIWGESLYFPGNGIAAGQAPVDTFRVETGADYQAKDQFLPVGQASFVWQIGGDLALEGYVQFEGRRSRINPQDAYAGASDVLGAEEVYRITLPAARRVYTYDRLADHGPSPAGQYGAALRRRGGEVDYGLYALRFNARNPVIHYFPGAYRLDYPRGIEIYGASAAGSLGEGTFGAEISGRRHMPLVTGGVLGTHTPTGESLHGQFSWTAILAPRRGLADGAEWSGEIAANRLLGTPLPGRTNAAAAFRAVFRPHFFNVLPRLDLTLPVGLGYNFLGLSSIDPAMNRGTGDVNIGVTATFAQAWEFAAVFTHYFGHAKNAFGLGTWVSGGQSLADWDFLAVTVKRTF